MQPFKMRNRISAITLWFLMALMLWVATVFCPRYKLGGGNATLAWDGAGYYWYLPSIFIYHDLGEQHWADSIIRKYQPGPSVEAGFGPRMENGHMVMQYSSGLAVMELPFFLIAHLSAKALGYPADGFSLPYQMGIQFGALLVSFLGLWVMRRLLLRYYSDGVVALSLALLVIGTNFLNYSSIDGSISHCWLFTVYALLMLCSASFYETPTQAKAAAVGLLGGLAVLTRPTEIVAVFVPLLWDIANWSELRKRATFLYRHQDKVAMAVLVGGLVAFIQPLYWKLVGGHWLIYSYGEQGFSWLPPHVLDYAFSYRSGWLTYTPLMYIAVAGLALIIRRGPHRLMLPLLLIAAFYIVSAWNVWWYAGMGGRAMIQYYALLLFPLAAALDWLRRRKWRIMVSAPLLLLFTYANIWLTYQAHSDGLYDPEDGMSADYYWRVIGRWSAPPQTAKLKDGHYLYDAPLPANAKLVYEHPLHSDTDSVMVIDGAHAYSPQYNFYFRKDGYHWLRAEAHFFTPAVEPIPWKMLQFCLGLKRGNERVRETMIRVQRFTQPGEPVRLWVDFRIPLSEDFDSVNVHFANAGSNGRVEVRDLKVWAF